MTSAPRRAGGTPTGHGDAREKGGGGGSVALVLGLLAVGIALSGWIASSLDWSTTVTGWAAVVLGLAGVVVGFVGARRAFHDPHRNGGAALGGLALGLIGLVIGAWLVLPPLLGIGTFGQGLTLDECMAQAQGQQQERMCASQHLDEYKTRFRDPAGTNG